jgi:hypothetical protein
LRKTGQAIGPAVFDVGAGTLNKMPGQTEPLFFVQIAHIPIGKFRIEQSNQ